MIKLTFNSRPGIPETNFKENIMSNEISQEGSSPAQNEFLPEETSLQEPPMVSHEMPSISPEMSADASEIPTFSDSISSASPEAADAVPEMPAPVSFVPQETTSAEEIDFPKDEYVWHYSLRDLTDEIFWAVVFLIIWGQLFYPSLSAVGGWGYFNLAVTGIFGIGIVYFTCLYSALEFFTKRNTVEKTVGNEVVKIHKYKWKTLPKFLLLAVACLLFCFRIFSLDFTGKTAEAPEVPAHSACAFAVEMIAAQEAAPASADAETAETPADAVPVDAETAETPADAVPADAETAETPADAVPADAEIAETPADAVPADAEIAETPVDAVPADAEIAETPADAVPADAETAETPADAVPADAETAEAESGSSAAVVWENLKSVFPKSWNEAARDFFIFFLGIGVWCYVFSLLARIFFGKICTWYRLTPTVLICRSGFFITKERRVAVWDIQRVEVKRNLWQRFLGVGTLELHVRDGNLAEIDGLDGSETEESVIPDNIIQLPGIRMHGIFTSSCEEVAILNTYSLFLRSRMGGRMLNPMGVASSSGNQRMELNAYFRENFSEKADQNIVWKYRPRDLSDEALYCLICVGLGLAVQFGMPGWEFLSWLLYGLAGLGAIWLLVLLFIRRKFTHYGLNDCHFTYTTGVIFQQMQSIRVTDIVQVTLTRSWWERIIRTGTLHIRFRTSSGVKPNPLVIRGIGRYSEMFEKLDYYRMYHRLVQYFGMSV